MLQGRVDVPESWPGKHTIGLNGICCYLVKLNLRIGTTRVLDVEC